MFPGHCDERVCLSINVHISDRLSPLWMSFMYLNVCGWRFPCVRRHANSCSAPTPTPLIGQNLQWLWLHEVFTSSQNTRSHTYVHFRTPKPTWSTLPVTKHPTRPPQDLQPETLEDIWSLSINHQYNLRGWPTLTFIIYHKPTELSVNETLSESIDKHDASLSQLEVWILPSRSKAKTYN